MRKIKAIFAILLIILSPAIAQAIYECFFAGLKTYQVPLGYSISAIFAAVGGMATGWVILINLGNKNEQR